MAKRVKKSLSITFKSGAILIVSHVHLIVASPFSVVVFGENITAEWDRKDIHDFTAF